MNTQGDLLDLYAQWRTATEAEGRAIGTGQWQSVLQQQTLKRELQQQILRATDSWQTQGQQNAASLAEYERVFRPIVQELIALESQNHALLCVRRAEAEAQQAELDRSATNLRSVKSAYSRAQVACWESYS